MGNKYNIGKIFKTNEGCKVEIIQNLKYPYKRIKFLDDYGYECNVRYDHISDGYINNPFHKSLYNIGYMGSGNYNSRTNNRIYSIWSNMIYRCYNEISFKKCPTYKTITVDEEWHNFQNFAEWYEENFPKNIKGIKFHLDKDLLQYGIENKIYSSETCIFLPQKINVFIVDFF